jgi:hypothetical protein
MDLTDRECDILINALAKLDGCEQIELVLNADFAPKHRKNNKALNAYKKNSILAVMTYPLAKMFFLTHNSYDEFETIEDDLANYIKSWLKKMKYGGEYLSQVSKAYKKK